VGLLPALKALLVARFGPYDVIYVNSLPAAVRGAIALAGPRLGKKIAYHSPDYFDPFAHPIYFRLEGRLCRKADLYMNNEFHRGYITQALHRMRCPVITAPPNLPLSWPCPDRSPAKRREMAGDAEEAAFVLMLHGGYSELRMVPQLLRALALLPDRIRLVMTGSGNRNHELEGMLRELGLKRRVVTLPGLGFCDLLAYTVNADCGVLLYQNNDLGNFFTSPGRLTEYLACGLPVLASNHTGLEDLVLKYGLGEAVLSTEPESIAAGVLRLEAAVQQGRFHRQTMRKQFLGHFAFEHWEPVVVGAFRQLVTETRTRDVMRPPFPWLPKP
jgi:glycosyltransferase involved in cell wall biosynthesis